MQRLPLSIGLLHACVLFMRAYVLAVAGAACTVDDLLHALNRTFEGFKNIVETKLGPSLNMRALLASRLPFPSFHDHLGMH